jgi:23S rRNA-/tRNA-specific pseudouridylate synthase
MGSPEGILTVGPEEAGLPVDRFVIRHLPAMTRAKLRLAFESGRLLVNGTPPTRPGVELQAGDRVEVLHAGGGDAEEPFLLHEDPAFLVFFKPAGKPLTRHLLAGVGGHGRYHRRFPARVVLGVDDRLSGVVVAAFHPGAVRQLSRQFSGGGAQHRFTALVAGSVPRPAGRLAGGPEWRYKVTKRYRESTLLSLVPPPARRVDVVRALAAAGLHPARLPGGGPPRLAIHTGGVSFAHPRTGRTLFFDPPLPGSLRRLLDSLESAPTLAADLPATPPHGPADQRQPPEGPEPALRSPRQVPRRGERRR